MTLGSLFDGSGGFPLAGVLNGIMPLWSSEIEPYPLRVTAERFPNVKQLGSVLDINGAEIEPVDIITFGSPCQDLSVAGKQKGIHAGERSNLFFEAVRIIKEMRNADRANGRSDVDIRPRFAVWENVPGAFSSNKGEDFRAVLEALGGVCQDGLSIPRPKKWSHAGCVVGDGWSVAWRVYDAQYWPGTPQRRKRIYLVADFASERAGEILFERESVCGNPAESGTAREGAAADAERGAGRGSLFEPRSLMEENWHEQSVKGALRAEASKSGHCVVEPSAFMGGQNAKPRGNGGVRCLNQWDSIGIRQYDAKGIWPALTAGDSGGQNRQGVCYAIKGNFIDRDTRQNGVGWRDGEMYTLDTTDKHGVCYPDKARALTARHDSSPCVDRGQNVIAIDCRNMVGNEEVSATLQAKNEGGYSLNYVNPVVYRSGGYGDMVEGVGTLRGNGGDVGGGGTENIVVERVGHERER